MAFKAIGFDIDGTLYPSLRLHLALAGYSLRHFRLLRAFAAVRHELRELAETPGYLASPPDGVAGLHLLQARLVARRLGIGEDEALDQAERFFYRVVPESFGRIRPFQGVREALGRLKGAGLPLGALSDFPGDRKLKLMDLDAFFDVSMTSEETGFLKPHPRPVAALAERLGVAPGELLYVGNSVRYDVAGARAAGARSALISRAPRLRSGGADFVFRTYGQLVQRILSGP